jgi:hypothetical protein
MGEEDRGGDASEAEPGDMNGQIGNRLGSAVVPGDRAGIAANLGLCFDLLDIGGLCSHGRSYQ